MNKKTFQTFGYTSDSLSRGSHKKVVRVCDECGKVDVIMFYNHSQSKHPSLCKPCVIKGERHYNWKGGKTTLVCKQCGKKFDVIPSEKDTAKFCSQKCWGKWQSEKRSGKNAGGWKGGKIAIVCKQCGKKFKVFPGEKQRKFCSHKCRGEWQSGNEMGENNPNWNQNLTDDKRIVGRNYPEYKQWIKDVYKRDNYTCQVCGDSTGGNLNAHHIESYMSSPAHRTKLSNGITMCEYCHKNFHHIYGRGNNTRDQYNEFLMTNNFEFEISR
jgi:endogenous inhibitor of DNA gyrase (YacG/DUF329 family)